VKSQFFFFYGALHRVVMGVHIDMGRRWRSRRPVKPSSRKKVFLLVFIIFSFFSVQSFIFIERNLRPPLMNVAKVRVKQVATQAINSAISERIAQGTDFEKLIDWRTDKQGKIQGFMLNYAEHMKISAETVRVVQETLDRLTEIPEYVPLGQAIDSAILSSFGPDVPVKLVPAGAVKVELNTRQKDAGINMLLVEVYIRIIAEVTIVIPFDVAPEIVTTEVPISYLLVVGDVPMYYFDNKGNPVGGADDSPPMPNISLPNNLDVSRREGEGGEPGTTFQGESPIP
jgi:sporulation protein YunB